MKTVHTVINGDCRDMGALADGSVDLVVTSPPYWQLKDYGDARQIGFHDSYETYINHLNLAWAECARALRAGRRLCVNIGDQFARSVYYGRYKVIPIHAEVIRCCEALGLDFMGQIIWQKTTTTNTTGGASVMGSFPFPPNGVVKLDYEYILLFKKPGSTSKPSRDTVEAARMTTEEWNTYFTGHWNFAGARQKGHIAMFPEELPRRLIRMLSFPGETVLDPFAGSGTTALAARKLGRNSFSYEINPEFMPVIRHKIGGDGLLSETRFPPPPAPPTPEWLEKRLARLPYRFVDVHRLDKKIDVKKLLFGSRLDAESKAGREEYFRVRRALAPDMVELCEGPTVRLLGIRPNSASHMAATEHLWAMVDGKRVYLRYDETRQDREKRLLAYLYLENRTFINARLIKTGLVGLDDSIPFRQAGKFRRLMPKGA